MDLENLKKEIPFKWRVQSVNQYGASCVAYIDARQVQDLLDEVVGAENWQCKYSEHKGNLFCEIGIRTAASITGEYQDNWVWKSDCGVESNVEKQKGEASDAFKRSAVMWGVGRFLYSLDIIKIKTVKQDSRGKFYPVDGKGNKIWDITKFCNDIRDGIKAPAKKVKQGWLYKTDAGGNFTKEWHNVLLAINNGRITEMKQIEDVYQLKSDLKEELNDLLTKDTDGTA